MRRFLWFWIVPAMSFIQLKIILSGGFVEGDGRFTATPPSVMYVLENGTANFTWDYDVDDRAKDLKEFSPTWNFYIENATSSKSYTIGFDNQFNDWAWEIASTCPVRLLNPTRVSKESNATLIIKNVTTLDSGIYGCSLVFKLLQPKTEKTLLIVTVPPQIDVTGETKVLENTTLTLICSAVGPPTPNVTWINETLGDVLSEGIKSVTLKIMNISREQNGAKYRCNATNNPTTSPSTTVKTVTVLYSSKFSSHEGVNKVAEGCSCDEIEIICPLAEGSPPPRYYLYSPSNETIKAMKTGVGKTFKVKPQSGTWTCRVTNGIGKDIYHNIPGKVLPDSKDYCEHCLDNGLSVGEIVGIVIGVLAGVAIIAVIAVVIYKKKKRSG